MDIKISYKKPEDIAFVGTHRIWDQTANGAPRDIDESSRIFLWPAKVISDVYVEDFIDVLVAPILRIEDVTAETAVEWPTNDLVQAPATNTQSVRYVLGTPKRFTLSEACIIFPAVASTRGNSSGVYVK